MTNEVIEKKEAWREPGFLFLGGLGLFGFEVTKYGINKEPHFFLGCRVKLFYRYLGQRKTDETKLFINERKQPLQADGIRHMIQRHKHSYPNKNLNCSSIRMSVCRNLLKQGKDLRVVQTWMGHKYPSSTERYKPQTSEELKAAIEKYHPLK